MALQKRYPRKDPKAVFGEALRQLRQDAGYSQASAAAKIDGYGEDSIQKAEAGKQLPVDDLYDKLLALYQATPREQAVFDILLEHARAADPVIPEFARQWVKEVEPGAAIIRAWGLDVLPGLTQTYDFAQAMYIKIGMDEPTAAALATARVERTAILDRAEQPVRLTALIYEPLLRRKVGTAEIMAGELEHILEMMNKQNVVIQVVRETDYFPGHYGQFMIASGRAIPDTLILVNLEDHMTTAPAVVDRAIMLFEDIRSYALSAAESRALIQEAIEFWKSSQQSVPAGASPATATVA